MQRAVALRKQANKTSTAKLNAMLDCAGSDGRARGLFQSHGTSTGRYAGRLIQPHNLYRVDPDRDGDDIKRTIDGLKVKCGIEHSFGAAMPEAERQALAAKHPAVEHPVVRTHPETGEKILYACGFSTHFVNFHTEKNVRFGQDKTPGASLLLNYLCSQAAVPEYQVRFTWEPGSVAFWDNHCTQHYAVQDYWPAPRKMERAAIMGDQPF